MTRGLNPCRICGDWEPDDSKFALKRGLTRHKDGVCSYCRRNKRDWGHYPNLPLRGWPWGRAA